MPRSTNIDAGVADAAPPQVGQEAADILRFQRVDATLGLLVETSGLEPPTACLQSKAWATL